MKKLVLFTLCFFASSLFCMDKVAGQLMQKLLTDQEWQIGTTALTVLTGVLCCTYYASDSNEEALRDRIPDEWQPVPTQPVHPYDLPPRHRLKKLGSPA